MKRRINIFHTTHPSIFAFSSLESLEEIHGKTEITPEDIAEHYAHVANFEMTEEEHYVDSLGELEDDYAVCEMVFHLMNSPAHVESFVNEHVSQDHIREQRSHTSTSVGDIVQVDKKFYYCDNFGFELIEVDFEKVAV